MRCASASPLHPPLHPRLWHRPGGDQTSATKTIITPDDRPPSSQRHLVSDLPWQGWKGGRHRHLNQGWGAGHPGGSARSVGLSFHVSTSHFHLPSEDLRHTVTAFPNCVWSVPSAFVKEIRFRSTM